MKISSNLLSLLCLFGLATTSQVAEAGTKQGKQALQLRLSNNPNTMDVVQNRFFIKEDRFEISVMPGLVPNNPMVSRYTGGLLTAYHFSESLAAEGAFVYSPDLGLNDIKGLTTTLVQIAHDGSGSSDFQQPVDKMELGATFAASWAPIYGKINLIGESVLNFDFYGVAGVGMLSINKIYAVYNEDVPEGTAPVGLTSAIRQFYVPLNVGFGMNFFLTQSVALKLDARSYLYYANKPQYDPEVPELESRVYNTLVASAGISVFFPQMRPRIMDF
jgi:outer membrane beta-barrel protein